MKGLNLGGSITHFGENKVRVELDRKALFALASDTRMDILMALQKDRRTLSQLSGHIQVDKAAVHRHLKKLEDGGFVSRVEEHGFVYYTLTWKARDIISPGENTRIVVLISSALLLLVVCALIVYSLQPAQYVLREASSSDGDITGITDPIGPDNSDNMLGYVGASVLAISSVLLLFGAGRKLRRPRQPGAEPAESLDVPVSENTFD
jgi:DNA-binding transcriptional ArsR family regulator